MIGDVITWTNNLTPTLVFGPNGAGFPLVSAGSFGQSLSTTTITAEVTGVTAQLPFITIVDPGTGYEEGDQVRVAATTLTAALGQAVTQDLLNVVIAEGGVTDLGNGIATLSQTDWTPATAPGTDDDYSTSAGTALYDFRYNQTSVPTSIDNEVGSSGTVGAFAAYDPDGEGRVDAVRSPL